MGIECLMGSVKTKRSERAMILGLFYLDHKVFLPLYARWERHGHAHISPIIQCQVHPEGCFSSSIFRITGVALSLIQDSGSFLGRNKRTAQNGLTK